MPTGWVKVEWSKLLWKYQILRSAFSPFHFDMVCVNQIIPHMQDWKVHREREGTGCESINRCTQSQPGCSPWTLPSLGQQKKSQRGNYSVQILLLGETQLLCTVCMSFLSLVALSFVINWPIQEIKLSDTSRYHCNVLCPLDSRHDVPWKMRKTSLLYCLPSICLKV